MIFFVDTSEESEFRNSNYPVISYIRDNMENYYLLNFMSPYSMGDKLQHLTPSYELAVDYAKGKEEDFERKYFDYLLYDKDAFLDVMEIMMSEYYGGNVIVLTDLSAGIISEAVEVIRSFIYKRYEENPVIVRDIRDIIECDEEDRGMSEECIPIFARDKEYYILETSDPDDIVKNSYAVEVANGGNV